MRAVEGLDGGAVLLDRSGSGNRATEDGLGIGRIADLQGSTTENHWACARASLICHSADLLDGAVEVKGRTRGHRDGGADGQAITTSTKAIWARRVQVPNLHCRKRSIVDTSFVNGTLQ